jgi:hypothetical protein
LPGVIPDQRPGKRNFLMRGLGPFDAALIRQHHGNVKMPTVPQNIANGVG